MDVPPTKSISSGEPWKKFIAFTMVAIMVVAGFAILAPILAQKHAKAVPSNPQENQASTSVVGPRQVTWTFSHFGESYKKSMDYSKFGQSSSIDGLNQWWWARQNTSGYNDYVVRTTYPEITMNSPMGSKAGWANPTAGTTVGYLLYSFYREDVVASNLSTIATGVGKTPLFVPILNTTNGLNMDGGFVNWSFYCQYVVQKETDDIFNGTHFANTFYGVPAGAVDIRPTAGFYATDGYWFEINGKVDFNASATQKFLGLAGKGDLRTEFNTANAGGAINAAWNAAWTKDGSSTGTMNIYAAYEYPIDAYNWWIYLTVDPTSTANHLVLKLWSVAWGTDMLMNRYLDVAGIMSQQNNYEEDAYINGTATPSYGNIVARMVESYHLSAWSDPNFYSAAWMLAPWHVDYDPTNPQNPVSSWNSRYNQYNGIKAQNGPRTYEYSPGTVAFSYPVLYWNPLNNWNLTSGEKIIIKLGNRPMLGISPYRGTSDVYYNTPSKVAEISSHFIWGELTLGNGFPTGSALKQYYNGATKTMTITGPQNFPQNKNTLAPTGYSWTSLNLTASPNFIFDVSRVSNYSLAMVEPGPYSTGVAYHMTITAKNFTGVTVTNWNGTVDLTASAGATFGASSMWFRAGSNGVQTATVTFSTNGAKTITVTDRNNSLDVYNSLLVQVGATNSPPSVTQLVAKTGNAGAALSFSAIATDADGDTLRYTWNFGDATALQVGQTTTHTYVKAGMYTFTVYVDDLTGITGHNVSSFATASIAFNLPLVVGWNLVSVPVVGFGYKASTIGLAFGDVIVSWNWTTQSYDHNYIKGISPSSADFSIAPNAGYWIWVAAAKTLHLFGSVPTTLQTYTFTVPSSGGWIAIGFESLKTTWHASNITGTATLPGFYTGPPGGNITLVSKYSGVYTTFIRLTPLNNFLLVPGAGYWCWATASGTVTYMP